MNYFENMHCLFLLMRNIIGFLKPKYFFLKV